MPKLPIGALVALALLVAVTGGLGTYAFLARPAGQAQASAGTASSLPRGEIEQIVRETIVRNPEILIEAMNELERKDREAQVANAAAAIAENLAELENDGVSHVAGNPDGDVTLVEFFDYRCGYCKRARPEVSAYMQRDPNLRVVLKEYPILGPDSEIAARAAIAARKQGKYWAFHERLMEERSLDETRIFSLAAEVGLEVERLRTDMQDPAVAAEIERNHALADRIGVQGTPNFVIGGRLIPGVITTDDLAQLVKEAREGGGITQ